MHRTNFLLLSVIAAFAAGCRMQSAPTPAATATLQQPRAVTAPRPPVAEKIPSELSKHGHIRVDDYYWLKERDNPRVLAYLEAENRYTREVMAPNQPLVDLLFEEIKGRIKQTDMSVPFKRDNYYYYTRFQEGQQYPLYCRKRGSLVGAEEIFIDAPALAAGQPFFAVQGYEVSSGEDILAYAVDTVGRRIATIHFKNLTTGQMMGDVIPEVTGNMAWANDNRTLLYAKQDPVTLRSARIYRHELGRPASEDQLVYEEKDDTFSCEVLKTKSKKYLLIASEHTLSSEVRYLPADDPASALTVFLPRERDHEYSIDHFGDSFFIRTNRDGARNFKLMKTRVGQLQPGAWQEVIAPRSDIFLADFGLFRDHLVVAERRQGLLHLRILPWDGSPGHELDFGEPAYLAMMRNNFELDTATLRYMYTSLTTPESVYDYDMVTRTKTLLKREEVLGGYDPVQYETQRLYASAPDGVQVPISIVYRRGLQRDGSHPLLLAGYGSYGSSSDPSFNSSLLSLLERGFVFAIAHVRGGQELGRSWYEDGKLLKKKNTFTDFIACAEFLVREGYTRPDRLYAIGGSAGGLLMGSVANMRPDLFNGIVARVPFVDVVTTMLEPDIPLTTSEYDEWGDPNKKEYYDYMISYSPYDNVEPQAYPHMLVTTGLHDSQVQYWEPAKWVAKLRELKKDNHLLLLETNMEAGHGGASGRYKRYRETAFIYAFLIDLAGVPRGA
jgi:oligopeptidase B